MKKSGEAECRNKTGHLIDSMLAERAQLLSLILKISDLISIGDKEQSIKLLEEFKQVLVDYIAAGHFGLYERIIKGEERRQALAQKAIALYPKIEEATACALELDKRYSVKNKQWSLSELEKDLSKLGEKLAVRIDLEDQLIQLLQYRAR